MSRNTPFGRPGGFPGGSHSKLPLLEGSREAEQAPELFPEAPEVT